MDQIGFGEWLSRRRKSLGLTQKQLADRMNCATITLRKIEAGERLPSTQIVEKLEEIFNIPGEEHNAFLRFARGDIASYPIPKRDQLPWQESVVYSPARLPAPLTSIIGREQDLATVIGFLTDADIRLVTLVGPPGIGKTRLSHEIARQMLQNYPDGVYFAGLSQIEAPNMIAAAILHSIGFEQVMGASPFDRLVEGIANKHMFIVMDNLEHLIDAAGPVVYDLLLACPRLKILTTSRESLHLAGEQVYIVPPLKTPSRSEIQTLEADAAKQYPGIQLFVERAKAVHFDFSLTNDNFRDVAAVCAELDGLPLAIELMAARINMMTPKDLSARLNGHLILHTKSKWAQPSQHESLDQAINWSYGLLSPEEKRLFAFLSVFNSGFSLEAVEEAFAELIIPESLANREIVDLITSLVEKSLLQNTIDNDGEERFYMLNPIQQFAAERLGESNAENSAWEQYLKYFLKLSRSAVKNFHGSDQDKWLRRIEIEQENLRGALNWCINNLKTQSALSLGTALGWCWMYRGNYSEMVCWVNQIKSMPDLKDYPISYAKWMLLTGQLKWEMREYDLARSSFEECLAIGQELGFLGERIVADAQALLEPIINTDKNYHSRTKIL